ncbi:hypothetical protein SCHPADRAFT_498343 [Schizopora paradoxa]|uniref:Uncharacterized protein n=1 Tax=Schizopora paradoxa TaxID=27342 RepID=A0A0H2RG70_9AGAM|nr:hypothetical protein SCHPADRAFT_498343 [Schizopora paradoxa]
MSPLYGYGGASIPINRRIELGFISTGRVVQSQAILRQTYSFTRNHDAKARHRAHVFNNIAAFRLADDIRNHSTPTNKRNSKELESEIHRNTMAELNAQGPLLKSSESPFFKDATDATFSFTPSAELDPALGTYGKFTLTTLQGSASATLFTPGDDISTKAIKTTKTTTFNWSTIDVTKALTLNGEVVLSGKQNTITATFYQPSNGALVAALVGTVEAGFTGFTRVTSFTWTPAVSFEDLHSL